MRRHVTMIVLLVAVVGASTLLFLGRLTASPPESQELGIPTVEPAVITTGIPSFVTFSTSLIDPNIKRPKLQFFDPAKGKWLTVKALRDDGKRGDRAKRDGVFTLRLRLFDSVGVTEISLPGRNEPKVKGRVATPAQLRLVARKKGQTGIVVSATFTVESTTMVPLVIGDGMIGPPVTVQIPETIDARDTEDQNRIVLTKTAPDGYQLLISVRPNPNSWALEPWILACYFGPCTQLPGPGLAQTLSDFHPQDVAEGITAGPLSGLRVHSVDLGGEAVLVFLEDLANRRVIVFEILPQTPEQAANLDDNIAEAMSIIMSLRLQ